jgi:hypothetical protein
MAKADSPADRPAVKLNNIARVGTAGELRQEIRVMNEQDLRDALELSQKWGDTGRLAYWVYRESRRVPRGLTSGVKPTNKFIK